MSGSRISPTIPVSGNSCRYRTFPATSLSSDFVLVLYLVRDSSHLVFIQYVFHSVFRVIKKPVNVLNARIVVQLVVMDEDFVGTMTSVKKVRIFCFNEWMTQLSY